MLSVTQATRMFINGNITRAPAMTTGGMCFIPVAVEMASPDGKPMPTFFVSVKCWGVQAEKSVAGLAKGDRVRLECMVLPITGPDTRSPEQQAAYPRDMAEYRLIECELVRQKAAAPAEAPAAVAPAAGGAQGPSNADLAALVLALSAQVAALTAPKSRKSKAG